MGKKTPCRYYCNRRRCLQAVPVPVLCSIPAKPEAAFSRSSRRAYVLAGRGLHILDKPQCGRLIVVQKGRLLRQNAGRVCEGSTGRMRQRDSGTQTQNWCWDRLGFRLFWKYCSGSGKKKGKIYQECCSGSGKRLLQLKTVVWRAVKKERLEAGALHELLLAWGTLASSYQLLKVKIKKPNILMLGYRKMYGQTCERP